MGARAKPPRVGVEQDRVDDGARASVTEFVIGLNFILFAPELFLKEFTSIARSNIAD